MQLAVSVGQRRGLCTCGTGGGVVEEKDMTLC